MSVLTAPSDECWRSLSLPTRHAPRETLVTTPSQKLCTYIYAQFPDFWQSLLAVLMYAGKFQFSLLSTPYLPLSPPPSPLTASPSFFRLSTSFLLFLSHPPPFPFPLALLQDIKLHEGRRLAVCLQFSSFDSTPYWVVYCVSDLDTLSLLYITLKHGMETSRTQ